MTWTLGVKRLSDWAKLPTRAHSNDLGLDLFACNPDEPHVIPPHDSDLVHTGITFDFPSNIGGIIKDRSSMALSGIFVHAGVIDPGYRGEVKVLLYNSTDEPYHILHGDKIAQMILVESTEVEVKWTDEISDTDRGTGGFGSSGR